MALGRPDALDGRLLHTAPLPVIGAVNLENGDYVDLGRPLQAGGVAPLLSKALAFPALAFPSNSTSSSHG